MFNQIEKFRKNKSFGKWLTMQKGHLIENGSCYCQRQQLEIWEIAIQLTVY